MTAGTVTVGPFVVADATRAGLTEALAEACVSAGRPTRIFALHVGGLNQWRNSRFVALVNDAEWVYADGAAVVLVARAAGATDIQRAPTTDLAHEVLDAVANRAGRTVRIALIGGPPGLAERAARQLEDGHAAEAVGISDGFQRDWSSLLQQLRRAQPDVVFVGMGMPREAEWVTEHLDALPPALIMTCGGWFGFLAGEESRAPERVQQHGAEWIWRLVQSPRLLSRYVRGAATTASLVVGAVAARKRNSRRQVIAR